MPLQWDALVVMAQTIASPFFPFDDLPRQSTYVCGKFKPLDFQNFDW
jgi:hypothetical protein